MANPRKPKAKPQSAVPTTKAPEVEALAADLIERQHHGLKGAVIKYGFTSKKGKRFGRVVLVREEVQTLTERKVCFLVIVSKLYWDAYEKTPIRREAALDELLCSMSYDGMTPRIEKIDFKGYRKNILRYGVQTDELANAFRGCQLTLPNVEDVERELAPPPRCNDCGDPASTGRQGDGGVPLCEACWKFRQDCADETNSNADDDGAHCDGCGSWGLESRLTEMAGARLLCYKCRETLGTDADEATEDADATGGESPLAGMTVTMLADGEAVEMTGEQFEAATDRIANMSPDEIAAFTGGVDVPGVDFTEHATAGAAR
jgi:hypothetical protein